MSKCEKRCEDCIHCDLCLNIDRLTLFDKNQEAHCKAFKDKSLFVELLVKPKDKVWCLECDSLKKYEIVKRIVMQISIFDSCIKFRANLPNKVGWERIYDFSQIGKTVFLTKEEAEKKLKEMQNESIQS